MAGNNALQILRTKQTSENAKTEYPNMQLLDGQLLFDRGNNWLYVGNSALNDTRLCCLETVHPNYEEECLTDEEVRSIWNGGTT